MFVYWWIKTQPFQYYGRSSNLRGTSKSNKTSHNSENVEGFVAGLRFEQQGKLTELEFKGK